MAPRTAPVSIGCRPITRRHVLFYCASFAAGAAASSVARAEDQKRFTFGAAVWDIAFSPDGQWIAVARETRLFIQHLTDSRRIMGLCGPSQQRTPVLATRFPVGWSPYYDDGR